MFAFKNRKWILAVLAPVLMASCAAQQGAGGGSSSGTSAAANNGLGTDLSQVGHQAFCMDSKIGVVGLSSSQVTFSGNADVDGDVVMLDPNAAVLNGGVRITGTFYADSKSQVRLNGSANYNHFASQDLTSQSAAVENSIASLQNLVPTQTFPAITSSLVINGNGGLNVVSVKGDIILAGGNRLVLKGSQSDSFILNVTGRIVLSGQSRIDVEGGVLVRSVMIHSLGSGDDVTLTGNSCLSGTIVAPSRNVSVSGGATVNGSVICGGHVDIDGDGHAISSQGFCSGAPVSECTAVSDDDGRGNQGDDRRDKSESSFGASDDHGKDGGSGTPANTDHDGSKSSARPVCHNSTTTTTTLPAPPVTTQPTPTTTLPAPPVTTQPAPTTTLPAPTTTTVPAPPTTTLPPQCIVQPGLCVG